MNFTIYIGRHYNKLYAMDHRALARDVIHDITDGRRHIGGIFFALRGTFLMEITFRFGR
jgi:hypothetical protein